MLLTFKCQSAHTHTHSTCICSLACVYKLCACVLLCVCVKSVLSPGCLQTLQHPALPHTFTHSYANTHHTHTNTHTLTCGRENNNAKIHMLAWISFNVWGQRQQKSVSSQAGGCVVTAPAGYRRCHCPGNTIKLNHFQQIHGHLR